MPSLQHESVVELFRAKPDFIVTLLREHFGVEVPEGPVQIEEGKLPSLAPVSYDADLVLRLGERWAVVLEVQLRVDPQKRLRWPVYLANLRARSGLPVLLVVVAPHRPVARRAAEPIDMVPPGWTLRALVLGPDQIPVVRSPSAAASSPELLVLSAMAHGRGPEGLHIAQSALEGWRAVDIARAELYFDLILHSLNEVSRLALEKQMLDGKYQVQSQFLRNFIASAERRGEALGEARGAALGEARGEARGVAYGEACAILQVLDERGVAVDEAARARILGCVDHAQLHRWLRRAVHARQVAELFEP